MSPDCDVLDPRTGAVVSLDDLITECSSGTPAGLMRRQQPEEYGRPSLEEVLELREWAGEMRTALGILIRTLDDELVAAAPGQKATERVAAGTRIAVITHGKTDFAPATLRGLYECEGELGEVARQYLRIGSVRADLRRVRPLLEATVRDDDEGPVATLVRMLRAAEQKGRPSIKVETIGGES